MKSKILGCVQVMNSERVFCLCVVSPIEGEKSNETLITSPCPTEFIQRTESFLECFRGTVGDAQNIPGKGVHAEEIGELPHELWTAVDTLVTQSNNRKLFV